MASQSSWPGSNSLLSGLFGSLQQAARDHLPTADVWQSLRVAAGTWQNQAAGEPADLTPDQLAASGREILAQAGVGIKNVNTYRGIAGEWNRAKEALHAADLDDQITASHVFVPPWATTTGDEQLSRYRLRIEWEITPEIGDSFTKWHSYELTAPLGSIGDALDQAGAKIAGDKYLSLLAGDSEPTINDYEIEQI